MPFLNRFFPILIIIPILFGSCAETLKKENNKLTRTKDTNSQHAPSLSIKDKDSIAVIYIQAIQDYMTCCKREYHLQFDTLFFGKHVFGQEDDFPDIVLPAKLGETAIRLISPEEGLLKQKQNPSSFYINMVGWVNPKEATFILVTFSKGMAHQFDVNLHYEYSASLKRYVLK